MRSFVVLLVFVFSNSFTTAQARVSTADEVTFWPDLDVSFSVRSDKFGHSVLTMNSQQDEFEIGQGKATVLPDAAYVDRKRLGPNAKFSAQVPRHFPFQLVVLGRDAYVLFRSGRIMRLPYFEGQGPVQVTVWLNSALAVAYNKPNGGLQIHLITGRFHLGYVDRETTDLKTAIDKINPNTSMIEFGDGDAHTSRFIDNHVKMHGINQEENSLFTVPLYQWDKQDTNIVVNKGDSNTPLTNFSSNGNRALRGTVSVKAPKSGKEIKDQRALPAPAKPEEPAGVARLKKAKQEKDVLAGELKEEVFGQDYALERFGAQISEMKKNGSTRPKVLVATGPTGSGKTFLAGKIANKLHAGAILEISGNEYAAHAGSLDYMTLLGGNGSNSPKGKLIEMAEKHPEGFTFVINEGEKMNPDIWKMLMEFLDTGVIKKVPVKNLVVIITSNRGAKRMFPAKSDNWSQKEMDARTRSFTTAELEGYFMEKDGLEDKFQLPPELMKRIDEIIPFGPVSKEAAILIAQRTLKVSNETFKAEYTLTVDVNEETLKEMALAAWNESHDARTVMRRIRGSLSAMLDEAAEGLDLNDNDTIEVDTAVDTRGKRSLRAKANAKAIEIPMEAQLETNPLLDPDTRARMRTMTETMNSIVMGQTNTVAQISHGVISRFGKSDGKPFTAFLIGPSGNGKSETGRALAKARYDDPKRFEIIPMGDVDDHHKFDSVFGSAAQMQGGDIERVFEQALRNNPNGCVLILDEISNMGGGNLALKAALFMRLYNIMEEGVYVSPRDGRKFNLSKYQFILTGNDGEDLFRSITADDLLMETWKENKDPAKVREILRKAGIPNAFINRMDVVSLTKPLLRAEVSKVTTKLWDSQTKEFLADYAGLEVEPSATLIEQLSKSFFSADKGGRAVRTILENHVRALLMYGLVNAEDLDIADLNGVKLRVNLRDSASLKTYLIPGTERKVIFDLEVVKDGKLLHTETLDATDVAPKLIYMNAKNALRVAIHEAGHYVGNDSSLTGERTAFITIRGGSWPGVNYYGYARSEQVPGNEGQSMTYQRLIGTLMKIYSGRLAQELAGFPEDAGWSNDLQKMRTIAGEYLVRYGLDREFVALPVDEKGKAIVPEHLQAKFYARVDQLMEVARVAADARLRANWPLVRSISAELLKKGDITLARIQEIQGMVDRGETSSARNPHPARAAHTFACNAAYGGF